MLLLGEHLLSVGLLYGVELGPVSPIMSPFAALIRLVVHSEWLLVWMV